MWPQLILSFIKKNYKALLVVLALGLVDTGVSYIKDIIHAGILAKQDAQIKLLLEERQALLAEKNIQQVATAKALENFATEKHKGEIAQKKVDQLVYEREHPSTVTHVAFTNITECEEALETLKVRHTEESDTLIVEIKQDRIIIAACEDVVKKQAEELVTANAIIAKDTEVGGKLIAENTTLKDDVKKVEEKRKFWRNSSVGEAAVIAILVLLL